MKSSRNQRTHIYLPQDLLREIDAIVGKRGRSWFLVETAREAVRRRKLLHFLGDDNPAWNDSQHSELAQGSAAWVRKLRQESESRSEKRTRRAKPPRANR